MIISTVGIANQNRRRRRKPLRAVAALLATLALLVVPATALGQTVDPAQSQYEPINEQIAQGPQGPGTTPSTPSTDRATGDLPFTGLDVGLLVAAAALLGGSGLVLRRMSASSERD
jgi:hypothetical protein